jgi:hypothetical protein
MTQDDWAIVYMAWMNDLPISDTIWRWEACKKGAVAYGHCGSCVKQPSSCDLCTQEECLEGGKEIAAAWKVASEKEA